MVAEGAVEHGVKGFYGFPLGTGTSLGLSSSHFEEGKTNFEDSRFKIFKFLFFNILMLF